MKEEQHLTRDDITPPLTKSGEFVALTRKEKAEELAKHFPSKMNGTYPVKVPNHLIQCTKASLSNMTTPESK